MTARSSSKIPTARLRLFDDSLPSEESATVLARVLLICDAQNSDEYAHALQSAGCELEVVRSLREAEEVSTGGETFDILILDCRIENCVVLLERITHDNSHAQIITLSNHDDVPELPDSPVEIVANLRYAASAELLLETVRSVAKHAHTLAENQRLKRQLALRGTRELVGHSTCMQSLRQKIVETSARADRVLIQGEAGTGKQVTARAIHDCSSQAHRPFLTVDCSVFTAAHLQRELLGERDGAHQSHRWSQGGRLSETAGGTLVLQHIDDLSLMLQADLARIFKERRYQSIGSDEFTPLTTKIIATTRTNLESLSAAGLFRADLLAEISQQTLQTPPLRDRLEDMAALTELFLRTAAMKTGTIPKRIPIETMEILCGYDWPENVRELETLIARACALDSGNKLSAESVKLWLNRSPDSKTGRGYDSSEGMSLRDMEQMLIESTFARFAGNRERTAKALDIGLRTLSGKLRDYGYPPRGGPESKRQQQKKAA